MRTNIRASAPALVSAAALAVLALTSCSAAPESTAPRSTTESPSPTCADSPALAESRTVASGLDAPWSIAFHGDTPIVSERDSARILELDADGRAREVGTVAGVAHGGEGGLLGIAVRGDHLYAYSTTDDGNRIQRFVIRGDAGSLSLSDPQTILDGIPAAGNHNGGRIAFGPDGMLYATTGDAGDPEHAQDRDSLAGKILRITDSGAIPSDNPFPGSPVYSYGHRNPQGLAWAADGSLIASEFGQNTWDELNLIEPGGNYGWPEVEGKREASSGAGSSDAGNSNPGSDFIDPLQQWATSEASPSGIAIIGDDVYVANLRGERLRRIPVADPTTSVEFATGEGRLRDAVAAPDGSLWVLTNNTDGRGEPGEDDDRILAFPNPAEHG